LATDRIILGIDPGTNILGYSVIHNKGAQLELVLMDVLRLEKITDPALKLKRIFETSLRLIETYRPDELSIEAPFFGKNVQSMLKLGRAQGVAIAAALYKSIPVFEYSPRKVKMAITGKGSASKEQVAAMLQRLMKFEEMPKYFDATDALAVAVCHYFQRNLPQAGTGATSWKAFLTSNPKRVVNK
jgi:crossover junction endodeoxyribonuclease RuvC